MAYVDKKVKGGRTMDVIDDSVHSAERDCGIQETG